jgi:hypothetical protein
MAVKVFAKNTTRSAARCGDFLQNLLDLDCPLITRKHLCPKNKNDRKCGQSKKHGGMIMQKETTKKINTQEIRD